MNTSLGNFYPGTLSNLYGINETHVVQSFCCGFVVGQSVSVTMLRMFIVVYISNIFWRV
jgi:hypothetical protein